MRAILRTAASLTLCAGLLGCDDNDKGKVVTTAQAATPQPPPRAEEPAPISEPIEHHRHHWRRHGHKHRPYGASFSEGVSYAASSGESAPSGDTAEESAASRVSSAPYPPPPPESSTGESAAQSDVWIDGYGRDHYAAEAWANGPPITAEEAHARRDPWHGYDVWRHHWRW